MHLWPSIISTDKEIVQTYDFWDYAPLLFQRLRMLNGIKEEDYKNSLGPDQILSGFFNNNFDSLYELGSPGKSGSMFYFTRDLKYMLKTIPEREFDSLRDILTNYYQMLDKNPNSLICRFYGMHRICW